jgi:glycine cleavage system transcriptional repressor
MMLVLALADEADPDALRSELADAGRELGLEALLLSEVAELDPAEPVPTLMVTVYGADHPGILHAVSAAMAERGVDITDLNTRLLTGDGEPIYALMVEVALPPDGDPAELESALAEVGREQGVEVSVRPLEAEAL